MKVEIEKGVWLAPWGGDPGRTLVEESARDFIDLGDALAALRDAREFHPFKRAVVTDDIFLDLEDAKSVRIETTLKEEEQPDDLPSKDLAAENKRLKAALERLASRKWIANAAISWEDQDEVELEARIEFAKKALEGGE